MPISKFRFVSPGVKIAEIDNSQLPAVPSEVGPVIIGRASRGPGLRAVKVDSMSEFVEIFGMPVAGNSGQDPWRDGPDSLSPAYGTYAAQAYLRSSSPITYVRLLGKAHSNAGSTQAAGAAGWQIGSAPSTQGAGGAYGLFLIPSGVVKNTAVAAATASWADSGSTAMTGALAAIFYCYTGSVELAGKTFAGNLFSGSVTPIRTDSNGNLKANIIGAGATTGAVGPTLNNDSNTGVIKETVLFNFNRTSKNFIRRAFNTNPTLTDGNINTSATRKTYVLGESFENMKDKYIDTDTYYGFIAPLSSGSSDAVIQNQQLRSVSNAQTGWTIAQSLGATGSYQATEQQKLFRFITHNAGAWEAQNLKISIADIKGPTNQFEEYGTFTVQVRLARDTDEAPSIVEQFTLCDLNPNSMNYLPRKIGDQRVVWDDTERRYRYEGNYPANSKYIRVDMNSQVDDGQTNAAFLPFGFYGPVRWRGMSLFSGAAPLTQSTNETGGDHSSVTLNRNVFIEYGYDVFRNPIYMGNEMASGIPQALYSDSMWFTASIYFPSVNVRDSSSQGNLNSPQDAYFGAATGRPDDFGRFDESYVDLVRAFPSAISSQDGVSSDVTAPTGKKGQKANSNAGGGLEYSFLFTLDDLCLTGSGKNHGSGTIAVWLSGSYQGSNVDGGTTKFSTGSSMTATGSNGYKTILDNGFNKFTMPLIGGFDGLNIQEKEPFNNTRALSTGKTELTSYAMNSIKMAVDVVSDPEEIEMNMISMPGITGDSNGATAQDHMISTCEKRADTFAIVDLSGDYTPTSEVDNSNTETDRKGDIDTTVTRLENRALNTSYAAAYYPWVQIRDQQSGRTIWVPPSVAALGTLSSAQQKSEVWFAPAGFTRGGLTEGAAGLPVLAVKQRLRSKDRDDLYAANINPIASFPAEGIVIFGQKTLQVTRSALDRINVRRLMIHVKRQISFIASRLLFEQNVQATWDRFTGQVAPFLDSIVARQGLMDYRVVLDETTTTPDLIDRNIMYAKIYLKPARAIEFIAIDFIITRTGASFED